MVRLHDRIARDDKQRYYKMEWKVVIAGSAAVHQQQVYRKRKCVRKYVELLVYKCLVYSCQVVVRRALYIFYTVYICELSK